jgi:hypothetical protein
LQEVIIERRGGAAEISWKFEDQLEDLISYLPEKKRGRKVEIVANVSFETAAANGFG